MRDVERTKDKTDDVTIGSDTPGCMPDIFKSPEITDTRVPGSITTDRIEGFETDLRRQSNRKDNAGRKTNFKGVTYVPETNFKGAMTTYQ
jgi:hypothetical protein